MRPALYVFYSGFFFLFFLWFAAVSHRFGPGGYFPPVKLFGLSFSVALMALLPLFAVATKGSPSPSPLATFLSLVAGFVCSEVFLAWEKASSRARGEFLRSVGPQGMTEGIADDDEAVQGRAVSRREEELEFVRIAAPLLEHPIVEKLACYRHHRSASRLEHSIDVAWLSYRCRPLSFPGPCRGGTGGAFTRSVLLRLYRRGAPTAYFPSPRSFRWQMPARLPSLSGKEEDIIKKHMWPLTLVPPCYAESWIVCFADTCCSIKDLLLHSKNIGERFLSG